MSDKEYTIILDCFSKNMNEEPNLPPSFRDNITSSKETIRLLADKVNANSQSILSRTVTIMAVEVEYALLELCNGIHEESPLAQIIVSCLIHIYGSCWGNHLCCFFHLLFFSPPLVGATELCIHF